MLLNLSRLSTLHILGADINQASNVPAFTKIWNKSMNLTGVLYDVNLSIPAYYNGPRSQIGL